jgi:hypothetical protein
MPRTAATYRSTRSGRAKGLAKETQKTKFSAAIEDFDELSHFGIHMSIE